MQKKLFVFQFVAGAALLAAVSCGDDPAPTAPSPVPAPGAPPVADAGGGGVTSSAVPPALQADLQPAARGDVRGLEPGQGAHGEFNAYDFHASWGGSMLQLALVEDEMRSMREASKPHRNRLITVGTCPVEPHHATQACGDPIWSGSRMLAGRLELPPIPLAECGGWIVVNAAELSDDLYDGWRNAPCPNPDGGAVGSDGSGETWPEYPEPPAAPRPPETVQSNVDAEIAAAGGLTAGGAPRSVGVSDLFENAGGTTGDQYSATSSDETVATVEVTDNPRVVVTPVGAGTATIEVAFLESGEQVEFDVTVGEPAAPPEPPDSAPTITVPEDKDYVRGQTIGAFSIEVRVSDGDDVTVNVSGLPAGLTSPAASGDGTVSAQVSGTVAADAEERDYTVTVTARYGENFEEEVSATFTITVNGPPVITNPGNKQYRKGEEITAFPIDVTDPNDGDTVTVEVSGLPAALAWSSATKMVSGTVTAEAMPTGYTSMAHTVTVTANDGVHEAVTATFTITVINPRFPGIELFDDDGPHHFVESTDGTNVQNFYVGAYTIDSDIRAGCPAPGTAGQIRYTITLPGRLWAETRNVSAWGTYHNDVTVLPSSLNIPLSSFSYKGGSPGHVVTDTLVGGTPRRTVGALNWPNAARQFSLVGPGNDPNGYVSSWVYAAAAADPLSGNGNRLPPDVIGTSNTSTWYIVDTVTVTIDQLSPAAPATGYCVIPVATGWLN